MLAVEGTLKNQCIVRIAVCAKVTKTSFDIPTSLKTSFKMKVVKDGASMGAVVIKLIQAYVNGKINLEGI